MVLPGVTLRPQPTALDCRVSSATSRRRAAALAAVLIMASVGLLGQPRLHSLGDGEAAPVRTPAVREHRAPRTHVLLTADQRAERPLNPGDIVELSGNLVAPPVAGT